jgi:hypothetical protein
MIDEGPLQRQSPSESATPKTDRTVQDHLQGLKDDLIGEESVDRKLADIELVGEEVAVGWKPEPHPPLSPEVRYLHVSRTINQLVTDRNRSVGIFLGMASILFAASTALLNVKPDVVPIIPLNALQYWCLPATFGTLAVISVFISLLLIRSRIGLIYEVTKMNAILGLHSKRVERVNPLSIFYLMHLLVVVLGGASAGFTVGMLAYSARLGTPSACIASAVGVALVFIAGLQALYYITILRNTSDHKLDSARR